MSEELDESYELRLEAYLNWFQAKHDQWLRHNFPHQKREDGLIGMMEELGELSHAHLKHTQHIRAIDEQEYERQALDAVGDILIYMASYCNSNGLSMGRAWQLAWGEVRYRDWRKFPKNGRTE